jgi:phage terminase large subunit GpA-like protein
MSRREEPFRTLEEMVVATAEAVRPPERLSVSQAAEKYRRLNNPGSYVGMWDNQMAPYLVEPMDEMTSLHFMGEIFVGPARCGKSDLFFNYLGYTAICDPADMMMVLMTQNVARDWSQGDLAKVFRHSPEIGRRLTPGRQNDNVHDKKFLAGTRLLVKWPTISELSGKTIPRLWLADYDRMDQDVDGEGSPFDLTRKRAESFRRYGMCVAESSPGFEITDSTWTPATPHEAPPTQGILALYNRGDRRRWYWRCPHCDEPFEASFSNLSWPKTADHMEAAEKAVIVCPSAGCILGPELKDQLNRGGRWIKEGQKWLADGSVVGTARRTDIASFWLKGPAALFQTWKSIVLHYLDAVEEFRKTGAEEALKTTVNTDQGEAYLPKSIAAERLPEALKARAEDWGGSADAPVVAEGVRFLIATVDVQKFAFVVQVHGIGRGGDVWIIDMFKIRKSERLDESGERCVLDPAAYPEDWGLLESAVIEKTYPLADGSGRRMMIKAVGCDSGGRAGVTAQAYAFWRRLRDQGPGHHKRFQLLKGQPTPRSAPRVRRDYPDTSQRKDRFSGSRGDVPVLFINSNLVKDQASAMLGREIPEGGMVHFPLWAPDFLYAQLTVETRTDAGWKAPHGKRNEAFDLLYYAIAMGLSAAQVSPTVEKIDWDRPPGWADEWDRNDLVFAGEVNKRFEIHQERVHSLKSLGEEMG